jgi:catechol 2,3-dioxygenase-like lactoylglutathione lyase family enzyme
MVMTADPLDVLRLPVVPIEPRASFAVDLLRRVHRADRPVLDTATVRYFAEDMDASVDFYRQIGFTVELRPSPHFAMLYRGDLRLLLSTPASHTLADGTVPRPGGWNRIALAVEDLDDLVERLQEQSVRFRTRPVTGVSVRLALIEDPSGNPVELFEPLAGYHEGTGGEPP